ncbi:NADPH-cytochrome P450 reductase-like protein [Tanacetum coccineum]
MRSLASWQGNIMILQPWQVYLASQFLPYLSLLIVQPRMSRKLSSEKIISASFFVSDDEAETLWPSCRFFSAFSNHRYETGDHVGVYSGNLTEAVDEVVILAGLSVDIYLSVHADKSEVNRRVVTHCSETSGSWFIFNTEYLPYQVKEEIQQAL